MVIALDMRRVISSLLLYKMFSLGSGDPFRVGRARLDKRAPNPEIRNFANLVSPRA